VNKKNRGMMDKGSNKKTPKQHGSYKGTKETKQAGVYRRGGTTYSGVMS